MYIIIKWQGVPLRKISKNSKKFHFLFEGKKGNLMKGTYGCYFKIYRYVSDLLVETKFNIVSEHLMDDSDKLAGAVLKGIIVSSPSAILAS